MKNPFRTKTGYGWTCRTCKINAGEPGDPFPTALAARDGLHGHVNDSHDDAEPDGAFSGAITWR